MSGAIAMGANKITGLGTPSATGDAATKGYVDTQDSLKVSKSGDSMTGPLAMGANAITGVQDPTNAQDAATKNYIDTVFGSTQSAADSAAAALVSEQNAANSASAALTSEQNAAISASAASDAYDEFDDRYLGAKSSAPTVDNDGDPLVTGALYFDTVVNEMRVFDGTAWKAAGSTVNGTTKRETFTATSGQTTFTVSGGYDATFADVYLNGVKLVNGVDVDVSSGSDVVLTTGAVAGDTVDVVAYGAFELANVYTKTDSDARFVNTTGDTMTGELGVPSVQFDTATNIAPTLGQVAWNSDEGTLQVGLNAGAAILDLGEETLYRVVNQTGSTIAKGTLVMSVGTIGGSGRIKVAPWDGSQPSKTILGLATMAIPTENEPTETGNGYVTHFGKISNIQTNGVNYSETWVDGDILYAGASGGLTKTLPAAPNTKTTVAIVIRAHASAGTLFIRPTYGSNLAEDELVEVSSLSNNDLLKYNSTNGRFENSSSVTLTSAQIDNVNIDGNTVSSTDTNGNIILDPNGTGFVQENVGGTNYNIVSYYDIGTAPNEIPLNQYLGNLAYQNSGSIAGDVAVGGLTTVGKALRETKVAIAASDIDLSAGNYFTKTISGTTTFTVSNTASSGSVSAFVLDLTNGGSATVNWFSGVTWAAGTPPTLTASGRDVLGFFTHDGGTTWSGFVLGLAMA